MVFEAIKGRGKLHLIERTAKKAPQPTAPKPENDEDFEEKSITFATANPSPYQAKAESGFKDFDPSKYDD